MAEIDGEKLPCPVTCYYWEPWRRGWGEGKRGVKGDSNFIILLVAL